MIDHDHPDTAVLTAGCPGCVARVRQDQRDALIATAPLRHVTIRGTYRWQHVDHTISYVIAARVPAGWTIDDLGDAYPDLIGSGFVMALPSDVVPTNIDPYEACESFEPTGYTAGAVIDPPAPPAAIDVPLFGM